MRTAVAGWLGALLLAAGVAAAAEQPNVLLITVDTLRPDALGWVTGGEATPAIDRLAREGFAFPAAVSPVPLTLPAHASLMTALVPPRHGVRDNGQMLGREPRLMSEAFGERGYTTAAFVSGYPLSAAFGLGRGFDHYDDELSQGEGQGLERPAAATSAAVLAWLLTAAEPWFVWVHYYDPHLPYEPPVELARGGVRGLYDGEVAAVDRAIARLWDGLAGSGRPRLTVFTADHGESLGEHGEASHGYFVYDSTISVPLIFHFPTVVKPGRSDRSAGLVDVGPTVRDLLGWPAVPGVDGVSLASTLAGEEQAPGAAYFETYQPWHSYGWAPLRGIRQGVWKWIAAPRPELYRTDVDPGESDNLYSANVDQGRALHRLLREILAREPVQSATLDDPEVLGQLRALGYLGAGTTRAEPPSDLPDPKDRLDLRALLTVGQERLEDGSARAALERFEQVLAREPENRFALSRSGLALLRLGDLPQAIERLRQALATDPGQTETRALLAEALGHAGDYDAAAGEWLEVTRRQPSVARHWSNLGGALGRSGRAQEAVEALARASALEPESVERLTRLAFAEFGAGRLAAAAGHLLAAAENSPALEFSHAGALGMILQRLGRTAEARAWLGRAGAGETEFGPARLELARIEIAAGNVEAARKALGEALGAAPELRSEASADPLLAVLLAAD